MNQSLEVITLAKLCFLMACQFWQVQSAFVKLLVDMYFTIVWTHMTTVGVSFEVLRRLFTQNPVGLARHSHHRRDFLALS